jgi:uncharacterized protein
MDTSVQEFLKGKRLAVVGVSRSGKKFGNMIHDELKQRGFQTFIVHPDAKEIAGDKCYESIGALKGQVDGVVICVPPPQAGPVMREAAQAGIRHVWLQQGAESPEAAAQARELGINLVAGKCILMFAPPVRSFHRWHRAIAGLFGQL